MSYLDDLVHRIRAKDRPGREPLALLANLQHGVVARWELLALGFSRRQIQVWLATGLLIRVHRGVYAVGHDRLTLRGRWMAAVLAGGPNALLSHRASIALHELRRAGGGPVDVTVPGRTRKGQRGIRVHNVRHLHADDCTVIDGIPVTSIHRALLDYAEVASAPQLRRALEEAERREIIDGTQLDALIARSRGRRGIKPLRQAISALTGAPPWTQSELESHILVFLRDRGFPAPHTNALVEGELTDFYWPAQKVILEADSYGWHKDRRTFENDRRKDTTFQLAGCRVMRVTQQRIQFESDRLESDLWRMLSASASGP